jgi:hypothetical protein
MIRGAEREGFAEREGGSCITMTINLMAVTMTVQCLRVLAVEALCARRLAGIRGTCLVLRAARLTS